MKQTTTLSPTIFSYQDRQVRTITDDQGNPWFVAKDVCEVLGYANPRKAVADHLDDDEKRVTICDTPGGPQKITTISESGLYTLIIRSNKPNAKKFRRWVTHEVLPAIRRTGRYAMPGAQEPPSRPSRPLTSEQRRHVQRLVARKVKEYGVADPYGYQFVFKAIKDRFRVATYKDIQEDRFGELIHFIETIVIPPAPLEDVISILEDPSDIERVIFACALKLDQLTRERRAEDTAATHILVSKDEMINLLNAKLTLLENKLNAPPRWRHLTDEEKKEIVELFRQGLSRRRIAMRMERAESTIQKVLKEAGEVRP